MNQSFHLDCKVKVDNNKEKEDEMKEWSVSLSDSAVAISCKQEKRERLSPIFATMFHLKSSTLHKACSASITLK